jgi:precorrin-6Y C5,15-methyltransferase (decarboxylating)
VGAAVITVIGLDGSPLTTAAEAALTAATLVVGGRRQLAAAPPAAGARTVMLGPLEPALAALAAHQGPAVVLASGDPGFFGIVRRLRDHGLACTVLPAVSAVSLAFARAGRPWDDAHVVSAHGRDPRHAINVCRACPAVAVLTGPDFGPAELGAALDGWQRRMIIAEHLGSAAERITECEPADAAVRAWQDPSVVLVLKDPLPGEGPRVAWPPACAPAGWALPEAAFDHRDTVITKAEVRALALSRLAPGPGRLVWDVGAGSGSVAIECARFGAAVIAIERNPLRGERARGNALRHGTDVRLVHGEAPAAFAGLPLPDAVFVGGGGTEVTEAVAARNPARIVLTLAAVERTGPACAALAAAGYAVEGALVQSARLSPLPGEVHRLGPINPVFVLWASRETAHPAPERPQ